MAIAFRGQFYFAAEGHSYFAREGQRRLPSGVKHARLFHQERCALDGIYIVGQGTLTHLNFVSLPACLTY